MPSYQVRFYKNRASWPDCAEKLLVVVGPDLDALLRGICFQDWYRVDITTLWKKGG